MTNHPPSRGKSQASAAKLAAWTALGLGGVAIFMAGALSNDWITFACGLTLSTLSTFLLGTGLWMRLPHGR